MKNIDLISALVTAILGAAYPILIQVIIRLDETYSSSKIIKLFQSEPEYKRFQFTLKLSIIFIFIRFVEIRPTIQIKEIQYLINNSASMILGLTTVVLLWLFFRLIKKIFIYSIPVDFAEYLKNNHTKIINENEER